MKKTKELFLKLLKDVSESKINNFSGLGLVLYNSKFFSETDHSDLRPSIKRSKKMFLGKKDTLKFLLEASKRSSPCHDGFHFFNEKRLLTHISQYFWPPIIPTIKVNELYGTRHLSAQYGSCVRGVIAIGIVHFNREAFYFENGKEYELSPQQWDEIYKRYKKGEDKYKYYDITKPHKNIKNVVRLFKKRGIKRILDLGCGAGRHTCYLSKLGFDVYGIDIAKKGIEITQNILKQQHLKANLKIGNVFEKLPYEDNFFDAVVSVQVLQHGSLEQIISAIKEIERVLKPKGLIFITLCGRYSKKKIRYCLVKTAKKIAPRTYVPTIGEEKGLIHYIYNKKVLKKHYKNFNIIASWKDERDYYCFIGENKKI